MSARIWTELARAYKRSHDEATAYYRENVVVEVDDIPISNQGGTRKGWVLRVASHAEMPAAFGYTAIMAALSYAGCKVQKVTVSARGDQLVVGVIIGYDGMCAAGMDSAHILEGDYTAEVQRKLGDMITMATTLAMGVMSEMVTSRREPK